MVESESFILLFLEVCPKTFLMSRATMLRRSQQVFSSVRPALTRTTRKPIQHRNFGVLSADRPDEEHSDFDPARPFKNYNQEGLYLLRVVHDVELAHEEYLLRDIIEKDKVDEITATKRIEYIRSKTERRLNYHLLPYWAGLTTVGAFGCVAVPLVYSKTAALWFNENYVTTDVPPPDDLGTYLEVGSWTWNWMEPWTGTFAFVILCANYSKTFIKKLGLKPYSQMMQQRRISLVSSEFPQYDPLAVEGFVKHIMVTDVLPGTTFDHK